MLFLSTVIFWCRYWYRWIVVIVAHWNICWGITNYGPCLRNACIAIMSLRLLSWWSYWVFLEIMSPNYMWYTYSFSWVSSFWVSIIQTNIMAVVLVIIHFTLLRQNNVISEIEMLFWSVRCAHWYAICVMVMRESRKLLMWSLLLLLIILIWFEKNILLVWGVNFKIIECWIMVMLFWYVISCRLKRHRIIRVFVLLILLLWIRLVATCCSCSCCLSTLHKGLF